ncbi:hypothetical protein PR048_002955 [Dryococelus australis]|uniref:DDE Tnp4 domain-containing protein n=1 Tax=Dryococelus australis TaxID=614101 RepID=A0ABQ9IMR4_9NEOP|nr:hypothetical protein PR048_002955 [Dryococelus australis]
MSRESFCELEGLVGPLISKKDTNYRDAVVISERLLIRYLATGSKYTDSSSYFLRCDSTISRIAAETTAATWKALHPLYMKVPSTEDWLQISNRFYELWNLPNFVGAIDGKHVRIQKLPKSGSTNYNYKEYHSVVLMAACDADARFTVIEVGHAGRNSGGGFKASRIRRWLQRKGNGLHLPSDQQLANEESGGMFPFYFVADEVFPI